VEARRIVVALGGNAFAHRADELTMSGQQGFAEEAMRSLVPLFASGADVVLTHGNGPQVGHMLVRVERSLGAAYELPLSVCVAETEGELGYVLAQSLHNVLAEHGLLRPIASMLTQVEVDATDPAFAAPEKPIGPFYDHTRAEALRASGFPVVEDAGRGWRRVVPSPAPLAIVEQEVIVKLLEHGVIVVAVGGGGIPVVRKGERLDGVDAVIDKDRASALLAECIGADLLLVLTGVPSAYTDFTSAARAPIGEARSSDVRALAREGHFPPGSMGPKMEAAVRFVEATSGTAIITDPAHVAEALAGRAGTIVRRG
jgi:carbamate kinase